MVVYVIEYTIAQYTKLSSIFCAVWRLFGCLTVLAVPVVYLYVDCLPCQKKAFLRLLRLVAVPGVRLQLLFPDGRRHPAGDLHRVCVPFPFSVHLVRLVSHFSNCLYSILFVVFNFYLKMMTQVSLSALKIQINSSIFFLHFSTLHKNVR